MAELVTARVDPGRLASLGVSRLAGRSLLQALHRLHEKRYGGGSTREGEART
jgi:hypothetical protein